MIVSGKSFLHKISSHTHQVDIKYPISRLGASSADYSTPIALPKSSPFTTHVVRIWCEKHYELIVMKLNSFVSAIVLGEKNP